MPLFLVEREFAEKFEVNRDDLAETAKVHQQLGIDWVTSFLSADKKKTYCLYEAPSAEVLREAARRLDVPATAIVEVSRLALDGYAEART